jgi:hypothetical protein
MKILSISLFFIFIFFSKINLSQEIGKQNQAVLICRIARLLTKYANRQVEYREDIAHIRHNTEAGSFFRAQRESRLDECNEIIKDLKKIEDEIKNPKDK